MNFLDIIDLYSKTKGKAENLKSNVKKSNGVYCYYFASHGR